MLPIFDDLLCGPMHPMMHRNEAMQLHMLSAALPVVLLFALSLLHRAFLICWLTTDVSDVLLLVAALMRCRYCSRDCQAAHWQQHKEVCKRISAGQQQWVQLQQA